MVNGDDDTMSVIDSATKTVIATVAVDAQQAACALTPRAGPHTCRTSMTTR